MKNPQRIVPLHFKSVQPQTAKTIAIPMQVENVLKAASACESVSHNEARELLRQVKDVVLEETGLTRQQLDYEIYLRTVPSD